MKYKSGKFLGSTLPYGYKIINGQLILVVGMIFIVPLIILGTIFSMGRGSSLMAGYNTMSKSKREQYDSVALCKLTGKIIFLVAFCVVLALVGGVHEKVLLSIIGSALSMITLVLGLIYVNTGNRFKISNPC